VDLQLGQDVAPVDQPLQQAFAMQLEAAADLPRVVGDKDRTNLLQRHPEVSQRGVRLARS
jgi:hypothetical protein